MNSGSEKKLSMEELMERNPPPQKVRSETHPTKEEWEELLDELYTLAYHAEQQTNDLKEICGLLVHFPTQTQMNELLKRMAHLETMAEQAGKPKESSFSPPGIRLPRLRLPHPDGPTAVSLLMVSAALFMMWWFLGRQWSGWMSLLR